MSIKPPLTPPCQGREKLVVILGPTASGKSKWAEKLCCQFNGEIVSADSRQIYRKMDIGTAKIINVGTRRASCLQNRTTHLIDIINPDQNFTVSQYKKLAVKAIKEIQKRGKIPFLVGGTGLYIQVVVDNLKIPRVKADLKLRQQLFKKTHQQLLAQLKKIDPQAAKKIDTKNKRRLIRALEVCLATGKSFSAQQQKGKPLFDILQIGIQVPRQELYQRINRRVEKMMKTGLVNEVKNLVKKYIKLIPLIETGDNPFRKNRAMPCSYVETHCNASLQKNLPPAFSGIGYQEIIQYLAGKTSLEQAKELIKTHTRQYARRQMTWFRRDTRILWVAEYEKAEKLVREFSEKKRVSQCRDAQNYHSCQAT